MTFNSLQQRLNRKNVSPKHLKEFPAFIKLYDILFLDNYDLREISWNERRLKLENWYQINKNKFFDLSKVLKFKDWHHLEEIKNNKIIEDQHEGLMIKALTALI